jgi:GntR family transcriptional repressor for pyruvate dehydrogenase complex
VSNDAELADLFTKISPRRGERLYEQVAEQIGELILSQQILEGERLPSEAELGELLSVSRTVVREGIKVLADKGLVRPEPGRGTFVSKPAPELLASCMDTVLRVERCGLADLLQLRRIVEVPVARLAASEATDEQISRIEQRFADLESRLESPAGFMLADKEFHVAVARATGNELSAALVGALMVLTWKLYLIPVQVYGKSMLHHRAILQALRVGDSEAAKQAMSAHHDQIWADLIGSDNTN